MGRLESLQKGVNIWTGTEEALRNRMRQFKSEHPFSWWFRRSYWKIESQHHRVFCQLINYRIKYVTALKEAGK